MRVLRVSVALLGVVGSACADRAGDSATPSRLDSAGVQIVTSGGEEVLLGWTLREVGRIGGDGSPLESLATISRRHFGVDGSGNMFVLDQRSAQVIVLHEDGGVVRVLGQRGGGPGEFINPLRLSVGLNGEVAVGDYGKFALVRFGPTGEVLPEIDLSGVGRTAGDFALMGGALVLPLRERRLEESIDRFELFMISGADTTLIVAGEVPLHTVEYPKCGVSMSMSRLFARSFVWRSRGDRLVVNTQRSTVIDVYDHGKLSLSIRRPSPARALTEERVVAMGVVTDERWATQDGPCTVTAAETIDGLGFSDSLPPVAGIAIAPDRSIWVKRPTFENEPTSTDVFAPGGEYVGTLRGHEAFPWGFLPDGKFVNRHVDEAGMPYLVIYEVDR